MHSSTWALGDGRRCRCAASSALDSSRLCARRACAQRCAASRHAPNMTAASLDASIAGLLRMTGSTALSFLSRISAMSFSCSRAPVSISDNKAKSWRNGVAFELGDDGPQALSSSSKTVHTWSHISPAFSSSSGWTAGSNSAAEPRKQPGASSPRQLKGSRKGSLSRLPAKGRWPRPLAEAVPVPLRGVGVRAPPGSSPYDPLRLPPWVSG
mmetsp:Transcript_72998/g.214135  ORF Transcript_72998/g.214135 Transcript_72998/m.214135 type:complete len:211 (+) Transcript_72998:589-1221(+)